MSNLEHTTSWQQIQQGVKEAERLILPLLFYSLVLYYLVRELSLAIYFPSMSNSIFTILPIFILQKFVFSNV